MTPTDQLMITNARVPGTGDLVDVLVHGATVSAISEAGQRLHSGEEIHDAAGRYLLPGLWDNHVHFAQWVIQQRRMDLTQTSSADEVLALVRQAAPAMAGAPLVAYGFRDGLWEHPPTLRALDEVTDGVPAVLISADLHCAWINTAAQHMLGVSSGADGLVREDAWFPALEMLQNPAELTSDQYRRVAEQAARRGVVGVVDFENTDNIAQWPQRVAEGVDALRVEVSVWPDRLDEAVARGVRTGDLLDPAGLVTMGPLKVIADGSLNTRTAWCWEPYPGLAAGHPHRCGMEVVPLHQLQELMRTASTAGIRPAIHAIGDRANTTVLDAFETLGVTGAVEHAQLLRTQDIPRFATLGLTASVQPEHAMDDRDIAEAYWAGRTGRAFALKSLMDAGAELRLGSDAPVAPLDPWLAISSAVERTRDRRSTWHPEQRIPIREALAASARGRSEVSAGDPADLMLVEEDPYTCGQDGLRGMAVAATMLGGRFTWYDL